MDADRDSQNRPGHKPDRLGRLIRDDAGATTLEYALLLAAIAIPSYWISTMALDLLVEHYRMMTLINSLPFP